MMEYDLSKLYFMGDLWMASMTVEFFKVVLKIVQTMEKKITRLSKAFLMKLRKKVRFIVIINR